LGVRRRRPHDIPLIIPEQSFHMRAGTVGFHVKRATWRENDMQPQWRPIGVVETPIAHPVVKLACDAAPSRYRALLASNSASTSRWELFVNFARGESRGTVAACTLMRTLAMFAGCHRVPLTIIAGEHWLVAD
jgi:hypothetical protein